MGQSYQNCLFFFLKQVFFILYIKLVHFIVIALFSYVTKWESLTAKIEKLSMVGSIPVKVTETDHCRLKFASARKSDSKIASTKKLPRLKVKHTIRSQFHQRSMHSFYVRKLWAQLFCANLLGLYFTGARLGVQKLWEEHWWNYPQGSISPNLWCKVQMRQ